MTQKIRYKEGYKYQLVQDYIVQLNIVPKSPIVCLPFIALSSDGILTIYAGYAWDGPTDPAIDTKNFMRPSLIHDALYQLMREGYLDTDTWRLKVDLELDRFCKEDGMSSIRRWWIRLGLYLGGRPAAERQEPKILEAP